MEAFLNMPLQDLRLTSFAALLLTLILAAVLLMQRDYITKRRIG